MRNLTLLLCLFLLAACGASNEPLPTVMSLPTDAPSTATVTQQVTFVGALPTSPAPPPTEAPATEEVTPSGSITVTLTPSKTITNTATPTLTHTPTGTPQPDALDDLVALALQTTILPPTYFAGTPIATGVIPPTPDPANPGAACVTVPTGGFGVLFNTDPTIKSQLGCPVSATNLQQAAAVQNFEYGFMVWLSGVPGYVYVFYANGTFARYLDTFVEGVDPVSSGETPPSPSLFEPVRGFGKVWRTYPEVRSGLGWATGGESSGTSTVLDFQNGLLLHVNTRGDILVLARQSFSENGTWRSAPGTP
jgi:hypothetical protein